MAEIKWKKAEVVETIDVNDHIRRLHFRVPELQKFTFKAGQFVTFDFPIADRLPKRMRSYTMISAPGETNEFELLISKVTHGAASEFIWNKVEAGTSVLFRGPQGMFTLPENIDRDLCFVCTGVGIAPFLSMLLDLQQNPRSTKNIDLIFGTRFLRDFIYEEELKRAKEKIPGFNFTITLSKEDSPNYKGRRGHVHSVYEELFSDRRPAHFICAVGSQ